MLSRLRFKTSLDSQSVVFSTLYLTLDNTYKNILPFKAERVCMCACVSERKSICKVKSSLTQARVLGGGFELVSFHLWFPRCLYRTWMGWDVSTGSAGQFQLPPVNINNNKRQAPSIVVPRQQNNKNTFPIIETYCF